MEDLVRITESGHGIRKSITFLWIFGCWILKLDCTQDVKLNNVMLFPTNQQFLRFAQNVIENIMLWNMTKLTFWGSWRKTWSRLHRFRVNDVLLCSLCQRGLTILPTTAISAKAARPNAVRLLQIRAPIQYYLIPSLHKRLVITLNKQITKLYIIMVYLHTSVRAHLFAHIYLRTSFRLSKEILLTVNTGICFYYLKRLYVNLAPMPCCATRICVLLQMIIEGECKQSWF